jgi:hypothetical protein
MARQRPADLRQSLSRATPFASADFMRDMHRATIIGKAQEARVGCLAATTLRGDAVGIRVGAGFDLPKSEWQKSARNSVVGVAPSHTSIAGFR